MQEQIIQLLKTAAEINASQPTPEAIEAVLRDLAKGYPGFEKVEYYHSETSDRQYVSAYFDEYQMTAGEFSLVNSISLLNDKMIRHFSKPQEKAA